MRDGQSRRSERKFFPGYVLVQMEMDDDDLAPGARDVPKVLGFIGGTPEKPAPITERGERDPAARRGRRREAAAEGAVRAGRGGARDRRPVQRLQRRRREVNYEKSRLRVAVQILGRSTPVELEFGQVEKA